MHTYIYGADSETCRGKPITLQFYSEDRDENLIVFVDEHTAMQEFFAWLQTLSRHATHVIYCHHLKFDLVSFMYGAHSRLSSEFEFMYGQWRIEGCYGAPTFCKIRHKSDRDARTIFIVDSLLWYQGTLAKAADLFCPGLPKLAMPKGLGEQIFSSRDDSFIEYAMRDAEVAYHIGKAVQAMHSEFDLPQSVSLASMSANIFRRHYLDYTIPQPPQDSMIEAALLSYHGGKNNLTTGAAPAWHTGVRALDISSAYPYAMSELPAFSEEKLYKRYKLAHRARSVPPYGVYKISGTVAPCEWPCIFSHDFKPLHGRVSDVWVQGLELNEALASGELKLTRIRGFYYDHERDKQSPALRSFVKDFYHRKETQTEKTWRHMYKITLNALYGKFIQTRKKKLGLFVQIDPETDAPVSLELRTQATAGGMYHPFIASAITAHTRAYIHQIEHAYQAIHTATDGIFTKVRKSVAALRGRPRSGLGSLQPEGAGTLLLLRNKCYILYAERKSKDTFPSKAFKGKHILKFAKHGFMGSVYDLEKLIAKNRRKYSTTRANTLRTSIQRGLQVNDFERHDYVLKIGPVSVDPER